MSATLEAIRALLRSNEVEFREVHHEPTKTSEESARARGEALSTGGKALLIKVDDRFMLFVLSAARKLDSDRVKRLCSAKKIRFATKEELLELTGLVPGSVPPFGPPILPFPLFVDRSIEQNERIAFNAGSLTDSMILSTQSYLQIAQPRLEDFSSV